MIGVVLVMTLLWPSCYQPPVTAPVVDAFRSPACTYCPGNRGLEYSPAAGSAVVAAAAGTVTFRGTVAGVRYLVVAQFDGRTATYGRLAGARVDVGTVVQPGEVIATTTDRFYFGLREGDRYIDPALFLGVLRYRPRLVPVDRSPPRRPPPPTMSCAAAAVAPNVAPATRWSSLLWRR